MYISKGKINRIFCDYSSNYEELKQNKKYRQNLCISCGAESESAIKKGDVYLRFIKKGQHTKDNTFDSKDTV